MGERRGYHRYRVRFQLLITMIIILDLPSIQCVLGVFWIHSSVMGSDDWQNVTSKKHRRSKEDDVLNISKSVYVTNFPDSTSARDLWKVCSAYGTVVDVFIPFKKSKAGKRFAFVRFIKVFNLDRLVENLCTIWIGRFHLFANHVRFDRPQKPNHSPPKVPTTAHKNSFAAVLKDSNVKEASVEPAIVLDDSCIKEFDFNLSLMGKVNEVPTIPNLPVLIAKEGFLNVKIKYLGGMWLLFDFDSSASKQKFLAHTGVRSWFSILKQADNNFVNNERIIWVSAEGLPVKAWTHNSFRKITSIWGRISGMVKEFDAWVPDFEDDDDSLSSGEDAPIFNNDIEDNKVDKVSKMSFIQEFDHVLNFVHDEAPQSKAAEALPNEETSVSEDPFGIYGLLHKNNNNNSGSMESVDPKFPTGFTPSTSDQEKPKEDPVQVSSNCAHPSSSRTRESKKNRGMTSFPNSHSGSFKQRQETKIEDIDVCTIKEVWGNMYFDHVVGPLVGFFGGIIPSSTRLLVISIYAPQELSEKCDLWNYLRSFISRWDGETVLMGGFNEVRSERERFSSVFNQQEGLFDFFPHLSAICLDKNLSDHRPILLRESCLDYGPTPFRFFHSWFSLVGFDAFVENTWNSLMVSDDNALICLQRKLQLLKIAIKSWTKEFRLKSNAKKCQIQQDILCLDKLFDLGLINDDSLNKRALLLNELHEINSVNASELSQKAKIRWSIEGDENSKFFHDIINKKRAQLAIRGILADGNWISEPSLVKNELFHQFSKQFSSLPSSYICLDYEFPVHLTSDQVEDLESEISNEEVKAAVWDCGVNKSPGPDGYTFEFFRKYWTFIGNDIIQAVKAFFANGCFPRGCNSYFIALIPKIQDAKFVKDFCPISLIGSTYKIISKILANRLCLVLPDLISDVQSAFVANRQILDGPFILNELMSWCKHTKFKGMIFKVDFEKAFDSVKWDYLDETLKSFGFGLKWRNWISGCLNNAKGSVLVNGNPTKEFQFFKGLKQGDPLSPFLFILVMETLHLSFKRIINAGLYRGISINGSLTLSHLFYADDVVFVGEWKDSNIHILLNVLKCFFLASGLKINLQKSKLMGLGVSSNVVNSAANLMGCSILQLPFNYLGVKVGCNMSYIGSWDDVISKVSSRLSKWKIKSLSIGGRLTLLKSVLTSIPLYHMSIFKVPMGVLKKLESIRRNFFNGHDGFARKSSWFNWNKALASKKNGGIGVSSFFAINRALLFKWVWRFFSDGSSLWSTFIKALFGFHGAIGLTVKPNRRSIWSDILQAVNSLKDKGIDFLQFIRKKIGNGVNTSFWADSWIGSIPFKEKFPRLYALEESKSISVADKLGLSSLYLSFRRPPRGGIEQESFNLLCQSVRGLVLSNIEDRWSWSLEGSGLFSVKSSRAYIDDLLLPKADAATRWIRILPIKINVFAWKVCLDALPTRCNMSLRGIDIPSILCPLCNRAVENSDHIFFSCSMVRKVWRRLLTWWELDVSSFHSYNEWISWLSSIRLPKLLKVFLEGSCYVMWWLVWKFRNRLLFSDPTSKPDSLFDDVVQMSFLWMNSRKDSSHLFSVCRLATDIVWPRYAAVESIMDAPLVHMLMA
ncbi:RNA-directed DNA polymerase, eukaryota, reverse transcriptase zinc-binding domain protein [Tanacetum coccineum]